MERAGKLSLQVLGLEKYDEQPQKKLHPGALRVAFALRALRQRNSATSFFFCPASTDGGLSVREIAEALSSIEAISLSLISLRTGKVEVYAVKSDTPAGGAQRPSELIQISATPSIEPAAVTPSPQWPMTVPDGVLLSDRFPRLVEDAKRAFRYVLVDAPSVLTEPGGMLAASHCDGAILTIVRGVSKMRDVVNARQQLELANVKVLGFVMEDQR